MLEIEGIDTIDRFFQKPVWPQMSTLEQGCALVGKVFFLQARGPKFTF